MEYDYIAAARQWLASRGLSTDIIGRRLYEDRVAVVLVTGEKFVLPFEDLPKPEPPPAPKPPPKPRRRRRRKT